MKVELDSVYDERYPEKYNWSKVDSPKVQLVAERIATAIHYDIAHSRHRILVPGLRHALKIIAGQADIY